MPINTTQRNLLIAASGVLVILLLVEINSEGLEGSHWIVVTALVAVLLFVAFSAKSKTSDSPRMEATPERFAANKGDEGDKIVKLRFDECKRQWEQYLKSSLVDRSPNMAAKDRDDLAPFLEMAAIKMAFANYLLIILHRGPDAGKTDDAQMLRRHAGGILTYRLHQAAQHIATILPGLPTPDRRDSLKVAAQQLSEYEILIGQCQQRFRASGSFPLDPLFGKVDDEAKFKIGDPASREAFFGIKYREETGRLLHPTPGITAL